MVDLCRRPGPVVARDQLTLLGHHRDRVEAELVVRKGPADYRCVGIVRTGRPNVAFAVNEYGSSELLGC